MDSEVPKLDRDTHRDTTHTDAVLHTILSFVHPSTTTPHMYNQRATNPNQNISIISGAGREAVENKRVLQIETDRQVSLK